MLGKSIRKRSIITERAAASPGAAQKSIGDTVEIMWRYWVEEEEVFRRIQTQHSTTNTPNMDTARLFRSKF